MVLLTCPMASMSPQRMGMISVCTSLRFIAVIVVLSRNEESHYNSHTLEWARSNAPVAADAAAPRRLTRVIATKPWGLHATRSDGIRCGDRRRRALGAGLRHP